MRIPIHSLGLLLATLLFFSNEQKLVSAEKSNVMETGAYWRKIAGRVAAEEYPDVEFEHILADNCAMQLVRRPDQFDVIVTDTRAIACTESGSRALGAATS